MLKLQQNLITVITKEGRENERLFFTYPICACAGSSFARYSLVEAPTPQKHKKGVFYYERAGQAERRSRQA